MKIVNKNNEEITGKEYLKSVLAGFIGFATMLLIIPFFPLLALYVLWLGFTGCLELTQLFKNTQEELNKGSND